MTHIELPRAVEAYFAFAELPATGRGRHFTITFTYMEAGRLDRLQWWWQVSKAQARAGDAQVQTLRQDAILRFRQHIERWLNNSGRCLRGGEPFPQLEALTSAATQTDAASQPEAENPEPAYVDELREYARMAAGR
ncbi:MAG: hypothetical protein ABIQ86_04485 [Steroidobacteraceae bacterium]